MEEIAQSTADAIVENAEEINQFTQYFQGKLPGALDFALKLIIVAILFFICRKLIKIILKILERSFERAEMETASAHFTLSVIQAILYVILAAILATCLGVSGASVAALLGSMGVGVVLALRESLSNIAGGFILLFMKPFVSGDYIHEDSNGNEGTVVRIDLFYTTLVTVDNRTVCIPNGIMANSSLTNISKQDKRQLREKVCISYRADIEEARQVLMKILEKDVSVMKK
ncbi:MAG: mechanosensitive ion channel family protein, partial [Hominisplanchenecus sp.]|nr:mechanosensitive ion channel family protein [Hominisplanchenecus sp.]